MYSARDGVRSVVRIELPGNRAERDIANQKDTDINVLTVYGDERVCTARKDIIDGAETVPLEQTAQRHYR